MAHSSDCSRAAFVALPTNDCARGGMARKIRSVGLPIKLAARIKNLGCSRYDAAARKKYMSSFESAEADCLFMACVFSRSIRKEPGRKMAILMALLNIITRELSVEFVLFDLPSLEYVD